MYDMASDQPGGFMNPTQEEPAGMMKAIIQTTKRQAHTKVVELVLRKSSKSEENVGETKPKAVIGS